MRFEVLPTAERNYSRVHVGARILYATLDPIVLAHEIIHIKLGHTTLIGLTFYTASSANKLVQETECWEAVMSLKKWSQKERKYAQRALKGHITEGKRLLKQGLE